MLSVRERQKSLSLHQCYSPWLVHTVCTTATDVRYGCRLAGDTGVGIHHELEELHERCGDLIMKMPRDRLLRLDAREAYQMAKHQYELAGRDGTGVCVCVCVLARASTKSSKNCSSTLLKRRSTHTHTQHTRVHTQGTDL